MKKIANKSIPLFQLEESHLESKYRSEGFTYMIVNGYEAVSYTHLTLPTKRIV